ncbi:hypothetical protein MCOR27_009090 [Pyricularia oryzae]|uniref:CFEM domain-containing protein n=5 Tax=Pyricularia TaxID=48558 RepID=A0ABQ8NDT0_PYRGI|nr:uncharacterized protein MGG_05083 [Pyricularia oryzae 70-15]ELQ40285.1 hypothetical protein OOU_Y34scaffold00451g11 [Pyricularia oryzae Y34]KAH8847988.1 hypothetical protein MCOR01_001380 [Pyricularia oryzae]KAI6294915.1 hypothetical protein MCOR33_008078 [Pyricularia grisea]EHA52796.1 hypothetical protein MGG_05083 [Pyricularia oryzae 70-15]KAH9430077.1 hypothetical protein MCOR02_009798 [Pyricularia oryzae]
MKSFVLVAALSGLAVAQFGGLPTCATTCATKLLGATGCNNDAKCICSSGTFIQDVSCCIGAPDGCGPDDQKKAIDFAGQLCAANGVTVPNVVSCPSLGIGPSNTTAPPAATSSPAANPGAAKGAASVHAAAPVGLLGSLVAAVVLL